MDAYLNEKVLTRHSILLIVDVQSAISLIAVTAALLFMAYRHGYGVDGMVMVDGSKQKPMQFHDHMAVILFFYDLAFCFMTTGTYITERNWLACQVVGRVRSVFTVGRHLWIAFIGFQLQSWVVYRTDIVLLRKRVYPACFMIIACSLIHHVVWWLLYPTPMVMTEIWCFYPENPIFLRLGIVFVYLYAVGVYTLWVFISICWTFWKMKIATRRSISVIHQAARLRVGRKLVLYIVGFWITQFGIVANRTVQAATGRSYAILHLLHLISLSLSLWDALAFSSALLPAAAALCDCKLLRRRSSHHSRESFISLHLPSALEKGPTEVYHHRESCLEPTIFATTYNCGGCTPDGLDLEVTLPLWLPIGHDLYIISVQELKGLKRFRSLVHEYLGSGGAKYTMFGQEIGVVGGSHLSGTLGCIAITIFARTQDVESSTFQVMGLGEQISQGTQLGLYRAGNKGAVYFRFRFHSMSFVALGVHLPADGSQSKLLQRNAALHDLLGDSLAREQGGLDVHLQFHHTILLGDLNYRICGHPDEVIDKIAEAARCSIQQKPKASCCSHDSEEKSQPNESIAHNETRQGGVRGEEPWLQQRYRALEVGGHAINTDPSCWEYLLQRDELRSAQAAGDVLWGFREGVINFPPSYRRVRGPKGDCWDYTDPQRLRKCFTTRIGASRAGAEEGDEEDLRRLKRVKLRVPSWTDRILVHSLPEVAEELVITGYAICDALWASDHRPVSSVLKLNLYPSIKRRALFNIQCPGWEPLEIESNGPKLSPSSLIRPSHSFSFRTKLRSLSMQTSLSSPLLSTSTITAKHTVPSCCLPGFATPQGSCGSFIPPREDCLAQQDRHGCYPSSSDSKAYPPPPPVASSPQGRPPCCQGPLASEACQPHKPSPPPSSIQRCCSTGSGPPLSSSSSSSNPTVPPVIAIEPKPSCCEQSAPCRCPLGVNCLIEHSLPSLPSSPSSSCPTPPMSPCQFIKPATSYQLVFRIRLTGIQVTLHPCIGANSIIIPPGPSVPPVAVSHVSSSLVSDDAADEDLPVPPRLRPVMSSSSDSSTSEGISQLAVLCPLPSETCQESSRVVRHLDSALFPSRSGRLMRSCLLYGSIYVDWGEAESIGVEINAGAVLPCPEGTMHCLIKLMDGQELAVAQGVIAVPRTITSGKRPVTVDLTLHSAYKGSLTCNIEVLKVMCKPPSWSHRLANDSSSLPSYHSGLQVSKAHKYNSSIHSVNAS